ncbi:MAG: hypothetical protein HDS70_04425, partial [Bacteroidales bacterium]|nr:hypothetical protein [Bacteroidales bacterium]
MKRILIIFITILLAGSIGLRADDASRIAVNAGVFAPYTLDATVAYEHSTGYGHSWVLQGEAGTHWQTPVCQKKKKKLFWGGGIGYRHRLVRLKNGSFRIGG